MLSQGLAACTLTATTLPNNTTYIALQMSYKEYGVSVRVVLEPNKHHFDVINGLACNTHPLFATVLGAN